MRYCKDCQLYECCMRSPLGGCQEFDNVAPKPAEPIVTKEVWKHLYDQLDWDWEKFRREAAKDIIPAILSCDKIMEHIWSLTGTGKHPAKTQDMVVNVSIRYADELIRQLKDYEE